MDEIRERHADAYSKLWVLSHPTSVVTIAMARSQKPWRVTVVDDDRYVGVTITGIGDTLDEAIVDAFDQANAITTRLYGSKEEG